MRPWEISEGGLRLVVCNLHCRQKCWTRTPVDGLGAAAVRSSGWDCSCRWHKQVRGIPQGAAASSLLCGLYLQHLADSVFLPALSSEPSSHSLPAAHLDESRSRSNEGAPPQLLLLNMTDDFLVLACDGAGIEQRCGRSICEALLSDATARQHLSFGAPISLISLLLSIDAQNGTEAPQSPACWALFRPGNPRDPLCKDI
jgi:hypothetical protein